MTRDEIIGLIVQKALDNDLVPVEFLGGAIAESRLDPNAERWGTWPDVSFGLFQQTVLYAPDGDHSPTAENVKMVRSLYFDPSHACDVAAKQYRYWRYEPSVDPLQAWAAYNGGAYFYHHWQDSPNLENYRDGLAEAHRILEALPVTHPAHPSYNLALPITVQDHDWDCAQESTMWGLKAAGRNPGNAWMEREMLQAGVESTDVGLVYGDGSRLAEWITSEYSNPAEGAPTLHAYNVAVVSFDDVAGYAGTAPVLMGGHNWGGPNHGHWTGVRGYDAASETLLLANPGGSGPTYGQQSLTREQFLARGPWSMVVITADEAVQQAA